MLDVPLSIPLKVPPNSRIYKDDCMFNFDTPENNPLGLDIDLVTYQGFSRGESYNYTADNFKRTGNNLYLNITKKLKPESERKPYNDNGEKSPKMQKLEIRDVRDEDLFTTELSIYDAATDKSYAYDEITPRFKTLVDQIIAANSSDLTDEVKQWEQEIKPCVHSENLANDNHETKLKTDSFTCSQCELNENLWICLICGQIGCGRSQYGLDLKGNSHALKHFEDSQHAVAIKLGSLSADSEADAYCYSCGDEVKVPGLADILKKYGIDLASAVKTEKNLIELNIDRNLNWEFQLDGANGEKLPPVFGPGFTGLKNLGNTCYLNSTMQSLLTMDEYKLNLHNKLEKKGINYNNPAKDLTTQLSKLYDGLFSGRYSKKSDLNDGYQYGIKPASLKTLLGEGHEEFSTQRQQDAHEFLTYFLAKVEKELGPSINEPLKFALENVVLCTECNGAKVNDEVVDSLVVNIDENNGTEGEKTAQLSSSISSYFSADTIEGYKCSNCNKTTTAVKTAGLETFPKNLIIGVQRIKLENWVPKKIDTPVDIPFKLDLNGVTAKGIPEGATIIKEEASFKPDGQALDTLLAMGFPEPRSVKALYNTGNSDAEAAMNWLFAHMEDADIDEPLKETETKDTVPAELIANLESMGFAPKLCKKALILNSNDINQSVEWLFNNPDDDGEIETGPDRAAEDEEVRKRLESRKGSGKYELHAVVCHKGTSPHTGHYVAFVKIDDKWILFNDEKVVECGDLEEVKGNGYIYFFREN